MSMLLQQTMALKKSINIFKAPMKPLKKRQLLAKFFKRQYIYSKNIIVSQISISAIINTIPWRFLQAPRKWTSLNIFFVVVICMAVCKKVEECKLNPVWALQNFGDNIIDLYSSSMSSSPNNLYNRWDVSCQQIEEIGSQSISRSWEVRHALDSQASAFSFVGE